MKIKVTSTGGLVLVLALVLALGAGWVMNIVKLFGADFDPITGEVVLRAIGVVFAPLGAVIGWF